VLHGTFEKSFLKIPKEVLISVMQNHQKYFPVCLKSGKLLPYFIFVCGTRVVNNETVVKGNERVLRARFRDAEFFWNEDIKKPLKDSRDKLKDMLFLSGVGSYYKKTERLKNIAENLAPYISSVTYWVYDTNTSQFAPSKFVQCVGMTFPLYRKLTDINKPKHRGGIKARKRIEYVTGKQFTENAHLRNELENWANQLCINLTDRLGTNLNQVIRYNYRFLKL